MGQIEKSQQLGWSGGPDHLFGFERWRPFAGKSKCPALWAGHRGKF
jgi:hypothetical protein